VADEDRSSEIACAEERDDVVGERLVAIRFERQARAAVAACVGKDDVDAGAERACDRRPARAAAGEPVEEDDGPRQISASG